MTATTAGDVTAGHNSSVTFCLSGDSRVDALGCPLSSAGGGGLETPLGAGSVGLWEDGGSMTLPLLYYLSMGWFDLTCLASFNPQH